MYVSDFCVLTQLKMIDFFFKIKFDIFPSLSYLLYIRIFIYYSMFHPLTSFRYSKFFLSFFPQGYNDTRNVMMISRKIRTNIKLNFSFFSSSSNKMIMFLHFAHPIEGWVSSAPRMENLRKKLNCRIKSYHLTFPN